MLQDACTKDVFRELDGFLVLMSVLSTVQTTSIGLVVEPIEQIQTDVLQNARLVFLVVSEAMDNNAENTLYFNVSLSSMKFWLKARFYDPSRPVLGMMFSLRQYVDYSRTLRR